jgi:hypothetical protein
MQAWIASILSKIGYKALMALVQEFLKYVSKLKRSKDQAEKESKLNEDIKNSAPRTERRESEKDFINS